MTIQTLHAELERLFAERLGEWPEAVIDTLAMARDTARRAVAQAECPHPADRIKTETVRRHILRTCLACGRQNVESPAPEVESTKDTKEDEKAE